MKRRMSAILVALTLTLAATPACADEPKQQDRAELEVTITGVIASMGRVRVALFSPGEASLFPDKLPSLKQRAPAAGGAVTFLFKDVPYGTYAVAAFHDQNANDVLDRNAIGVPKEHWGVSGKRPFFGTPDYGESALTLNTPRQTLTINLE